MNDSADDYKDDRGDEDQDDEEQRSEESVNTSVFIAGEIAGARAFKTEALVLLNRAKDRIEKENEIALDDQDRFLEAISIVKNITT